jgi:hypothetical protein
MRAGAAPREISDPALAGFLRGLSAVNVLFLLSLGLVCPFVRVRRTWGAP